MIRSPRPPELAAAGPRLSEFERQVPMDEATGGQQIYCGRIVGAYLTPSGKPGVLYRVSSRSFPNRTAALLPDGAAIVPRDPKEAEENPYIAYRCLRYNASTAVASNGSHRTAHETRPSALGRRMCALRPYGFTRPATYRADSAREPRPP